MCAHYKDPDSVYDVPWGSVLVGRSVASTHVCACVCVCVCVCVQVIEGKVNDPFLRNWLDLLCFLLSGLPANGTIAAEVAYM